MAGTTTYNNHISLAPGTIVYGHYEVIKCLGVGSMGMVYAVRHLELANHVMAMKVLFKDVARDEIARTRFVNEIIASYAVSHTNVVRAYEYFHDQDIIAFTMEYIDAGDLAGRLSGPQAFTVKEILLILKQICSGVQAIHDAGIIHRDLKPENILINNKGEIKITDFGIARTNVGPKLTEYGGVVGTVDYVSPEYLECGQVDVRSDIYALGVIAYEMVTGMLPFQGNSVIETMTLRLKTMPEPPINIRPDCSQELNSIIMKMIMRNPLQRYQTAKEILMDVEDLEWQLLHGLSYKNFDDYGQLIDNYASDYASDEQPEFEQQNKEQMTRIIEEIIQDERFKQVNDEATKTHTASKLNVDKMNQIFGDESGGSRFGSVVKKIILWVIGLSIFAVGYFCAYYVAKQLLNS